VSAFEYFTTYSMAKHLTFDGNFGNCFAVNLPPSVSVKEFLKFCQYLTKLLIYEI